jgi:hypothetical protein
VGCSVSFSFTGAGAIDYSKYKTIAVADFPIKAINVYAPLGTQFNQELKDVFIRQTKLKLVKGTNADLLIEGEITGYDMYNEAVAADGYASKVKLTVTVNMRFTNNIDHNQDTEQKFSAFRTFDASLINSAPDQLIPEIVKEIVDQIFMATVANW